MITILRRLTTSWVAGLILLLIAVAILVTGIGTPAGLGNMSLNSNTIATLGSNKIGADEIDRHVKSRLELAKRDNPVLDMPAFVAQGGFDASYAEYLSAKAVEFFGLSQGMAVGKASIDKQIADVGAFKGMTGEFDEATFMSVLKRENLTVTQFRNDLVGATVRQQLLVPVSANARIPMGVATPYAALMLETRAGSIGVVPSQLMATAAVQPTEAEIAGHYAKIRNNFMQPEFRTLRYAEFGLENVKNAMPTDAEVAAFYKANVAQYAATEYRTLSQVVLPDQAAANAFSAKIKAGQSFDAVATAAGFTPADTAVPRKTKAEYAEFASDAAAQAAFALAKGGVTAPVQSDFGWHVIRVNAIELTPGKSLEQARPEIFASIARQKTDEGIVDYVNQIEDAINDGASLNEVAKSHGLTVVTSPLVATTGMGADGKAWTAGIAAPALLKAGFAMEANDEPVVETLNPNKKYAIVAVDKVQAAAPLPLATVRAEVIADLKAARGAVAARKLADSIVAKVNKGASMAEAFAQAKMPAPQAVSALRRDLNDKTPPPVEQLFSMAKGKAKLMAAPGNRGWMVIMVTDIKPGIIASQPELVTKLQGDLQGRLGQELAEQFSNAAKADLGVKEQKGRVLGLKKALSGATAAE